MVLPTIFSAHAPAAAHRAQRAAIGGPVPPVALSPLDAFLLTRIAAFLPAPLTVLDLAADATDGDSVAVLRGAGLSVVVPRLASAPSCHADWRPSMMEREQDTRNPGPRVSRGTLTLLDVIADDRTANWGRVRDALPLGGTTLVLLAETDETAQQFQRHLAALTDAIPDTPILALPLGAIGTSRVLPEILKAHPPHGTRRFVALREQAPFFASSELGLSFPADDSRITVVLDRLADLVKGNFEFLSLVRDLVAAARKIAAIEAAHTRERDEIVREYQEREALLEVALVRAEAATMQTDAARTEAETGLRRAEAAYTETSRYAHQLEERLRYFEEEYLPWKNDVITNLEAENRGLRANKFVRAERIVRRVLRLARR